MFGADSPLFREGPKDDVDIHSLFSTRDREKLCEYLGPLPECHIFKENKLKMAKHSNCVLRYHSGANDPSKAFDGSSKISDWQANCYRPFTKKRKADDSGALIYDPTSSQIELCYAQVSPTFVQSYSNRAGRAKYAPGKQVHLSSDTDSYVTTDPNLSVYNHQSNTQSSAMGSKNAAKSSTTQGDYTIVVGELLRSSNESYEVLSFLGRGTFGQVVKCRCSSSKRLVAVKILKNLPSYLRQGNVEIQILQTLSQQDTESHNIVRAIECFQHKNHMCFVFELLEQNLYEYLKSNKFRPLSLPEIRPIAQQVLTALSKLKSLGLIHADLKPENIMLVSSTTGAFRYRVKVIDFGSACHSSKAVQNTYLQSRYYRAPEILLGLPFNEAIDMWSLGCVLAELFLGWPLYPGSSEYDQMRYIVDTQGLPPADMLHSAAKCGTFFVRDPYNCDWRMKTQVEYALETGQQAKEARKYFFSSLGQICDVSSLPQSDDPDRAFERDDRLQFASLLQLMLKMRASERVVPDTALLHPFITMVHLQPYSFSKRFHEALSLMQVCTEAARRKQLIGSRNAMQSFNSMPSLRDRLPKDIVSSVLPASQTLLNYNRSAYLPVQSVSSHSENAVAYYAAAAVAALAKPTIQLTGDRIVRSDSHQPYKLPSALITTTHPLQSGYHIGQHYEHINQSPSETAHVRSSDGQSNGLSHSLSLYDLVAASGSALSLFNAAVAGPVSSFHQSPSQSRTNSQLPPRTFPCNSSQLPHLIEAGPRTFNGCDNHGALNHSEEPTKILGSFPGQQCSRLADLVEPYLTVAVDPRTNALIETDNLHEKLAALVQRQQQQPPQQSPRYSKAVLITPRRNESDNTASHTVQHNLQNMQDSPIACRADSHIARAELFKTSICDASPQFVTPARNHPNGFRKPMPPSPVNSATKLLGVHGVAVRHSVSSHESQPHVFVRPMHPSYVVTGSSSAVLPSPESLNTAAMLIANSVNSDLLPINLATGTNAFMRSTPKHSVPNTSATNSFSSSWLSDPELQSSSIQSNSGLMLSEKQNMENIFTVNLDSPVETSLDYSYAPPRQMTDTSVGLNGSKSNGTKTVTMVTQKSDDCKPPLDVGFSSITSHARSDKKIVPVGRVQPMIKQEDVSSSSHGSSRSVYSPNCSGTAGHPLLHTDGLSAHQWQQPSYIPASCIQHMACPNTSTLPHTVTPELSPSGGRLQFTNRQQSFAPRTDTHAHSTRHLSAAHAAAAAYHNLMYFQLKHQQQQQQQQQQDRQSTPCFASAQGLNTVQYGVPHVSASLPDAWAASYYAAAAAAAAELELLFNHHSVDLRPSFP